MSANEGNRYLRQMNWLRARELCRLDMRGHPEEEAAYKKYCDDNREQIETMNAAYRGVGGEKRIASKVN